MTLLLLLAGVAAVVVVVVVLDRPFAREMDEFARRLDRLACDVGRLRAERDDAHALLAELVRAAEPDWHTDADMAAFTDRCLALAADARDLLALPDSPPEPDAHA